MSNKFKLMGTVTIKSIKQFQRGDQTSSVMRFTINYKVSNNKNTTFSCSTFNQEIVDKLKDNDYVELVDYTPISDKITDAAGNTSFFNSLVVREMVWIQNSDSQLSALEEEIAFGHFDVNSIAENTGQDQHEAQEVDKAAMLQQQVEIMSNQPIVETESEVKINVEDLLK